jgi:hypothetical protein
MPKITDVKSIVGAKLVNPIPARMNQVGATCGLYALSIVIKFWHDLLTLKGQAPTWKVPETRGATNALTLKEKLNAEIIARGGDPKKNPVPFTGVKQPALNLLEIAETLGSRVGEVFDAGDLAQIARKAGLLAVVDRWTDSGSMFDMIRDRIDQNIPCIMGYDNTDSGDPGDTTHGARAHWAVIFGYVNASPKKLVATHGWGNYYLWTAEHLRASNEQLDQFGKWGTWYRTQDPKTGKTGWDGPGVPQNPTAQPTALPASLKRGRPKDAVAAFHIGHDLDLKKQIVTVIPPDTMDFTPPVSVTTGAPVGPTGSGHHF